MRTKPPVTFECFITCTCGKVSKIVLSAVHPPNNPLIPPLSPPKGGIERGGVMNLMEGKEKYTKRIEIPKRFKRPSPAEVERYAQSIQFDLDGHYFCSYYDSVGWRVGGKSPMKSWQGAVRTWKLRPKGSMHIPVKDTAKIKVTAPLRRGTSILLIAYCAVTHQKPIDVDSEEILRSVKSIFDRYDLLPRSIKNMLKFAGEDEALVKKFAEYIQRNCIGWHSMSINSLRPGSTLWHQFTRWLSSDFFSEPLPSQFLR